MFRGNHPAKVDEKGRLKLPSAFRQLVEAATVTQFYVTSEDGECAQVWLLPDWEKREEQLAGSMEVAVQKYSRLTSFYGQQVEIDNQGRVLIPQILREAAALDGEEAAVIGVGQYIEVHNSARFKQQIEAGKLSAEERARLAELTRRKV